LILVSIVMLYP